MVEPFVSDRLRRAPDSGVAVAPSLAALQLLLAPAHPADLPAPEPEPLAPHVPLRALAADRTPRLALAPIAAPSFAAGYAEFRDSALATPSVAATYLETIRAQAEALATVWEAHVRGAVTLPAAVAELVRAAVEAGVR